MWTQTVKLQQIAMHPIPYTQGFSNQLYTEA